MSFTRRHFVLAGAGLGLAATVGAGSIAQARTTTRLATASQYDDAEAYFYANGSATPTSLNESGGKLAWGQSHVLASYLTMYHRFGDPKYLRLLVRNADSIFATRDSERGVTDYRGLSLPGWRCKDPYTAASAIFLNENQQRCLEIRLAWRDGIGARITIAHDSADTFSIHVDHPRLADQLFSNLSLDPASPDYVVQRILQAAPTPAGVTVVDRRTNTADLTLPRTGNWGLKPTYYVMAVNTGMITFAIADFCATVAGTPSLQTEFGTKAAEYLPLVEDAVAIHDADWREDTTAGTGWYVAERGAPIFMDGSELPHNQYLALGLTQTHLWRATGDPVYQQRVTKMLRNFHGDLVSNGSGGLVWPYWWSQGNFGHGYTKADDVSDYVPEHPAVATIEDISHAVIDVWAAVLGRQQGWVFTDTDLTALARTFVDRVAISAADSPDGMPTTAQRVDGTSASGSIGASNATSGNWAVLTPWDQRVHRHLDALFTARDFEVTNGYTLNSIATLAATA